ncbi:MAG: SRPBCC domain-containing protein [Gemmataceae bacterium]
MIRFEGVEPLPLPPAAAFDRLADAGWLARALPDAEVLDTAADRAAWRVKPKFAFMAGTLDTVAEVLDRQPPAAVRYRVVSKGVGSNSSVDATLTLEPADDGTSRVRWAADVTELGGLLKLVPRGLIQAAAQKVIEDVWVAVREKLASA